MNRFRAILALIFPYRTHLENEIEYLRGQLAQKQRRIDQLIESLQESLKPAPKVQFRQEPSGKLTPVQPRGWDEVRAFRRANQVEETADAVQSK